MKFKLDENVDLRILSQFWLAGYDVATVPEQKMTAALDTELIEVCHRKERCLVTADRDFSRFATGKSAAWLLLTETLAIEADTTQLITQELS